MRGDAQLLGNYARLRPYRLMGFTGSTNQSNDLSSDDDQGHVECADPLLVSLEQSPALFRLHGNPLYQAILQVGDETCQGHCHPAILFAHAGEFSRREIEEGESLNPKLLSQAESRSALSLPASQHRRGTRRQIWHR